MKKIFALALTALMLTTTSAFAADTHEILQVKKKFVVPEGEGVKKIKTITIKANDTLKFINEDKTTHQLHDKANSFTPVVQKPKEESEITFSKPGTYKVRCAIHPKMKLKVIVE